MGKKKQNDEAKKEKPIFGSGAEPKPEPKDDGLVRCVCTVACAWEGYHDEGDRVMVERELLENDPFFKGHFKAVDGDELFKNSVKGPQGDPKGVPGSDNADGADGNENTQSDNGNGESDNADGGSDNADGGSDNANGGQGELDLK